jgi:hypothetical protein
MAWSDEKHIPDAAILSGMLAAASSKIHITLGKAGGYLSAPAAVCIEHCWNAYDRPSIVSWSARN